MNQVLLLLFSNLFICAQISMLKSVFFSLDVDGLKRKLASKLSVNENVLLPGLEVRSADSKSFTCSWLNNGWSLYSKLVKYSLR